MITLRTILKGAEQRVRKWVTHRNSGVAPTLVSQPSNEILLGEDAKILVLRQDRIGDVLISVPVIRALRQRFPQAQLHMVLSTNNIAVKASIDPFVDFVHVYKKGLIGLLKLRRSLRAQRYDCVIDLMDNASATSGMLIRGANARFAIGVDKENRTVYTHVVPRLDASLVHIVDRICVLTWPLGFDVPVSERPLSFPLTETDRSSARANVRGSEAKVLGINLSGSSIERMYPTERIVSVVHHVKSNYPSWEVVILAAPQHRDVQQEVSTRTRCRAIPPSLSFREWASVISALDALLTPDTSTVHLAAAFSIPSVVLFVHDRADLMPWYPYRTRCEAVETTQSTIHAIPPENVINAVDRLLESA